MGIADDLLDQLKDLQADRSSWEQDWQDVVRYAMPYEKGFSGLDMVRSAEGAISQRSRAKSRSLELLDSTAVFAHERLAASIISLTMPRSDFWHGLGLNDPFSPEMDDNERIWSEQVRNYLFRVRYGPSSGFASVNEMAVSAACGLGTGVFYIKEAFGDAVSSEIDLPFLYNYCPLTDCYLGINGQGVHDTNFFVRNIPARIAVTMFNGKVSDKVKADAADPRKKNKTHSFLHAVMPRAEAGSSRATNRDAPYAQYWLEMKEKHLISDGGFFSFPYGVYRLKPRMDSAYGESPVMLAMAEIKRLQRMELDVSRGIAQQASPPMASVAGERSAGLRPLNYKPGANNKGWLDPTGGLLAKPIHDVDPQALNFIHQIQQVKRESLQDMLYTSLFQSLFNNPQMTATQVLKMDQKHGDLLGPMGGSIQDSAASVVEREMDILSRKGAFGPGTALEAPESLQGHDIGMKSTSPLDRLRRTGELVGANEAIETASMLAKAGKPRMLNSIKEDEVSKMFQEIRGAPAKMFKTADELDEEEAQERQQAEMAAGLEQAGQAADVAQKAMPLMEQMSGLLGET